MIIIVNEKGSEFLSRAGPLLAWSDKLIKSTQQDTSVVNFLRNHCQRCEK